MKLTSVFDGLHEDLILRAPRLSLPNQIDQVLRWVDKFGLAGLEKRIQLLGSLVRDHEHLHQLLIRWPDPTTEGSAESKVNRGCPQVTAPDISKTQLLLKALDTLLKGFK